MALVSWELPCILEEKIGLHEHKQGSVSSAHGGGYSELQMFMICLKKLHFYLKSTFLPCMNDINTCQIVRLPTLKEMSQCREIYNILGGKSQFTRKQDHTAVRLWSYNIGTRIRHMCRLQSSLCCVLAVKSGWSFTLSIPYILMGKMRRNNCVQLMVFNEFIRRKMLRAILVSQSTL